MAAALDNRSTRRLVLVKSEGCSKTSLNQAETLEEARRRALHTDPRTTARHYEVRIDGTAANLMPRPGEELLTTTDELLTKKG